MQNFSILNQGKTQYLSEPLFDHIDDIVHFVKDAQGRYVMVNMSLVKRLGFSNKEEVIGKKASEIFPQPWGDQYSEQDLEVLGSGVGIYGRLELHFYSNRKPGWGLTYKEPVFDVNNRVIGICGLTRDIMGPNQDVAELEGVNKVIEHIKENLEQNLVIPNLAEMMKMSSYQLDHKIKQLYGVSTGQYIIQLRIERACKLLRSTTDAIVEVALSCGYSDQSAFTRQFKQTTGMTPGAYRKAYR